MKNDFGTALAESYRSFGGKYVVHFYVRTRENSSIQARFGYKTVTICRIIEIKSDYLMAEAWAFCGPLDKPVEETGKFIALGRAIEDLKLAEARRENNNKSNGAISHDQEAGTERVHHAA